MGEVYRARDRRLGREVAVKVLPAVVASDPARLERFEREARAASSLNHPNIVTVHDFASVDGETLLVMELVRGESLRGNLVHGALPLRKTLSIGAGIAEGLATAHSAGIVHRDLKPENVMISPDGVPKILDFGLVTGVIADSSEDATTAARLTNSGEILGTVTYMSPEQARSGVVDFRSDQFSLGVMLYEMVTGNNPFRRQTAFETLTSIVTDEAPPLEDSVPEDLAWIIDRCLSKNPAQRYGSTVDLARDLARIRDRVGHSRTREGRRLVPASVSLKWLIFALSLVSLLAILATGAVLKKHQGETGRSGSPLNVDIDLPEATLPLNQVLNPVVISPDGRHLALAGLGPGGTSDIWLRDLSTGATRLLVANALMPAWSDDGRALAYYSEGKLKTVGIDGGPARTVCAASPEGTPTWSGKVIIFGRYSGEPSGRGLYSVDAEGGAPQLLVPSSFDEENMFLPWWPGFLPGGERFLYLRLLPAVGQGAIEHELMVRSLDGSTETSLGSINSRAIYASGHLLYVRDGVLLAHAIDSDFSRLIGDPVPIVEGLHYFRNTGLAAFSASNAGIIAWRSARRPSRLAWLSREGLEIETIASELFDPDGRLSADGNRYVVGVYDARSGSSDLWAWDFVRRSSERLTYQLLDERSPIWALDGSIIFRSDGLGGPPDIVQLKAGEDRGRALYRGPIVEEPEDMASDGSSLVFITRYIMTDDIYVLPLEPPGEARPLISTPFNETSPRLSPNRRWLAYASDLSGREEIYVRRFDEGSQAIRLSTEGGARPRWRPDGSELYFVAPGGRLMRVSVDDARFSRPQLMFQAPLADFEPAPDGSKFLVQLVEEVRDEAHLLINWTAKLETASGTRGSAP